MEEEQAKGIIEALLFASDRPLTVAQIKDVLEEAEPGLIKHLISRLSADYKAGRRSFDVTQVAGGYQLTTLQRYAPWLKKLYRKSRTEKLSHPALETLAIIAYRQPITRQKVENIRGVNVGGVLKTLLERSLVRISGRERIAGRPFLYATTRTFLEFFGLQSLTELPKLEEFSELTKEAEQDEAVKDLAQQNR